MMTHELWLIIYDSYIIPNKIYLKLIAVHLLYIDASNSVEIKSCDFDHVMRICECILEFWIGIYGFVI